MSTQAAFAQTEDAGPQPEQPAAEKTPEDGSPAEEQPTESDQADQASQGDPESYYHYALARRHIDGGRIDEAIAELEKAAELDPRSTVILRELAKQYLRKRNTSKARELYEKAVGIDPEDAESLYELGDLALRERLEEQAAEYFQQVIDKARPPRSNRFRALALYQYAGLCERQDKLAEAAGLYERLARWLGDAPASAQRDRKLVRLFGLQEAMVGRAMQIYIRLQRPDKAVKLIKEIPGLLERPGLGPRLVLMLINSKRHDLALEVAQLVQQHRPKEAAGYRLLARVYDETGDLEGFFAAFRKLAKEHPDQSIIHLLLGRKLLATGEEAEGLRIIESILGDQEALSEKASDSPLPAIVHDLLGKDKEQMALGVALAIQKRWPTDPESYGLIRLVYEKLDDRQGFIGRFRKFHEDHPQIPTIALLLGEQLLEAERGDEAMELLEPLLDSSDPKLAATVWKILMAYYRKAGQSAGVLKLYARTISEKADSERKLKDTYQRRQQLQLLWRTQDLAAKEARKLRGRAEKLDKEIERFLGDARKLDETVGLLAEFVDSVEDRPVVLKAARVLLKDDLEDGVGPNFVLGMLAQVDDPAAAAEDFKAAIKIDRRFARSYERLSAVLIRLDRLMDALDTLREAVDRIQMRSWKGVFFRRLARLYELLDRDADAIMTYRTAMRLNPADDLSRYRLAGVLVRIEQAEQARLLVEQAIRSNPDDPRPYIELAIFLDDQQDTDGALAAADRGLREIPGAGPLLYTKASLLLGKGEHEAALKMAEHLAEVEGFEDRALRLRANVLMSMKKFKEARKIIDRLIEKDPDDIAHRYLLSGYYVRKGDQDKSADVLKAILKDHPRDSGANNDLGYLWADRGVNLPESERMIRLSLQENPESSATLDSLGWVLYKQNKLDQALVYLRRSVRLNPRTSAVIWDHLGDVLVRLGRTDEAREAYEKARALLDRPNYQLDHDEVKTVKTLPGKLKAINGGKTVPVAPLGKGVK